MPWGTKERMEENMTKEMREIKARLEEISEKEAMKLYRMARRLQKHGGSSETVARIREEANELHMNHYPENLMTPFKVWKFAFK